MLRVSTLYYFVLLLMMILISIFSIGTLISFGEEKFGFNSGFIPDISMAIIEIISIIVITTNIKKFQFKGIPKISMIWMLLILITCINVTENLDKVIVSVLFWPLVLLAFHSIFKNTNISIQKFLKFWFALAIFTSVLVYQISVFKTGLLSNYGISATINYIFYPLLITPWILLYNNKKIILFWLFLILTLSLFSVKRSAILIIVLIAGIYIFNVYFKNTKKQLITKILVIVVILFASLKVYNFVDSLNNSYLSSRFENVLDDEGSGRLDVYRSVIQLQKESEFANWIIGHGHNGVQKDNFVKSDNTGEARNLSAHNDLLEVLYDYGIIGLILYLYFIVLIIKRFFYLKKTDSPFFLAYTSSLIIFLIMSFGSHLILYPTYFIFLTSFWGAIEGVIDRNNTKNMNNLFPEDGRY